MKKLILILAITFIAVLFSNCKKEEINPENNPGGNRKTLLTNAAAGQDQLSVQGTAATLTANNPTEGTGFWSIVEGNNGVIQDIKDPTTTFTGSVGTTYTLRWTISNNCGSSSDDVVISFIAPIDPRDKFVGTWDMNSSCTINTTENSPKHINIYKGAATNKLLISNFVGSSDVNIIATMTSANIFIIPNQVWNDALGRGSGTMIAIKGTGILSKSNILTINYYVKYTSLDNSTSMGFNCSISGTKN
ncbi:MAG TPA: hypothetical protein PKW80_06565 [Bacteroidales bacterium]|nr:hypothetical protein [Bacteroidales bacterium]